MLHTHSRRTVLMAWAFAAGAIGAGGAAWGIDETFETYTVGLFPWPHWIDAGLIDLTPPNPPSPSVTVESVTDAAGEPTLAVVIGDAVAPTQGFYRVIPASPAYAVGADVRVDRFADGAVNTTGTWAVQVGVVRFLPGVDFDIAPQVGLYASALTGGWRLYAADVTAFADIDLGLAAEVGRWYRVRLDLDAVTGVARSRVWDGATGAALLDRFDPIEGWSAADGGYDLVACFDGELQKGTTFGNLAVVDNIVTPPPPPPCTADFNGDGAVNSDDYFAFLTAFFGGCP